MPCQSITRPKSYWKATRPSLEGLSSARQLELLPLTPNGKVDRKALPAPALEAYATAGYVAPRTPLEEQLCQIWSDLLGVARVGIHDDFFALGGHSLVATRVVARVRSLLHIDLPLRTLFAEPTVALLARAIVAALPAGAAARGANRAKTKAGICSPMIS